MFNILVFGLSSHREELKKEFSSSLSCKILFVKSSSEFYSTAFSRVFDLWIIEVSHTEIHDIFLHELTATQDIPYIFLCNLGEKELTQEVLSTEHPKIRMLPEKKWLKYTVETFTKMMSDLQAQNSEKYLAGYLNNPPNIQSIVTKSTLMEQLLDLIKDIAPTESAIFLQGETGTGKELLANIFHHESRRKSGPFMAVNCGALPDTLLESELFGYEKGSFTGANSRRIGKIEYAAGGTLFLDEIEAMSEAMQVRLLRVLQEKSFQRLGGNIEIGTDLRIIAATNTDPIELLNSGKLRSDLYYRLSVFQVHVPPLRDRVEDIPLLTRHFINKKKKGGREYVQGVDAKAMKILLSAPWFGNIRELQNVIERAVMLANSETVSADLIHIPSLPITDTTYNPQYLPDHAFRPGTTLKSYKTLLAQAAERKYLVELLEYTNGRIGESAQLAGLTPRALYNKMKIYGLKKEDFKQSEDLVPTGMKR